MFVADTRKVDPTRGVRLLAEWVLENQAQLTKTLEYAATVLRRYPRSSVVDGEYELGLFHA